MGLLDYAEKEMLGFRCYRTTGRGGKQKDHYPTIRSFNILLMIFFNIRRKVFLPVALSLFVAGCASKATISAQTQAEFDAHQVADLFIVDCLLPGQVRRLGQTLTFLSSRKPIKTNAADCRMRGGEYVAYDRANYATALKIWLPLAQEKKPEAQTYVGEIYEKGYGLEPDYETAAKWYEKAANQGYSRAQINLGYLYEKGLGVEKDLVTALNWYRKASGLESEDLAFASTIEVSVRSEYEKEMKILRNELARSQKEIDFLRNKLIDTRNQLQKGTKKLNHLKNELNNSRNRFNHLKNSPNTNLHKLELQKQQLLIREADVAKQYIEVQQLENDLKQQNNYLSDKLAEAEKRTAQLNREISEQKQEKGQLSEKLAVLQTQLTKSNQSLEQVTRDFEIEKRKIQHEKISLEKQKSLQTSKRDKDIKKLANKLSARERANEELRRKMLRLEKQRQAYERELQQAKLLKANNIVYPPPSIEILEPPFTVTRGAAMPTVKLRSIVKQREITGRVTALAGLLTLNVNGRKEQVNESGLFSSMIKLYGKETIVNTVAIDKKGNKASLDFMLLAALDESINDSENPDAVENKTGRNDVIDFGPYHALIIGNQQYADLPNLDTPVNDATAVAKMLKLKYGFKTKLILNADRYTILSALNDLRAKLTEVDNLLIYYAGHGELDRVNLRGHWLPVDAERDNTANWISTIAITDIINAMSARHILVVADSCYSGAMTRSSLARLEPGMTEKLRIKWLKVMAKTRSRTVLTSGGLKPVLDSGINGHSIFANAFLEALADNEKIMEGQQLFRKVSDHLRKSAKRLNFQQLPEYAPIRHGGHESGDFFFTGKMNL